jgi:hypothetical protein
VDKEKDVFFFFNVIIEIAQADARGPGDLPHGCGMESLLSENLQGPAADLFLPLLHEIRVLDGRFNHDRKGALTEKNDRSFF